ncbi:MAG TPA: response regulator, partial [Oligoflexia bacterium]|nr:response regulator [Oligoflexia bacterium]
LALILPQDHLSLLRGVFSYYQLPRLCPFCAKSLNAMPPRPLWLPDYINFAGAGAKFAPGCAMCSQTGTVGFAGVSSVADCVSPGGVRITPGAGLETLAEVFVCAGAGSLWENGVRCYWAGDAALDAVRMLPKPCAAYELVCKRAGAESAPGGKGRDFTPEDGICLPEADLNWSAEDGARGMPVSGPDAFKMRAASKEKSQRSRPAVLEHLAEGLPEKTDTIELVRPRTGNAPLLLVVDDDADQREILRRVFEMEGYTVETAADGIDGIVSANRLMPDLIIVDFMMPDLDGRETIRRLKKNPQTTRIPVIALTAYSDPDVEYGLLKAGADDFCAKSVAKKVLMKRIEKLAGKP